MITRYKDSVEPVYTDGRDIDTSVGLLTGEGAEQKSSGSPDSHLQEHFETWEVLPEPNAADPAYYNQPVLQEPVWEWAIPLYYYIGGLSGASMALGAAVQLRRSERMDDLVQQCHWIGFVGTALSGGLLIYDLGRPARFLNMLRVFRPTSPMNMGAWILSVTGATAGATVVLRTQRGFLRVVGQTAGFISGVFGLGLATYTGVLVGSSAVPIWQASRRALPALFGSSAMTSVGSAFDLFGGDEQKRAVTRTFGTIGKVLELAAAHYMDREAAIVPYVARPLKKGFSSILWKGSAALTAASLVISLLPNQTRKKRRAAGVLGTLGSLLMRYTVQHVGTLSARDARATFRQQRAGFGGQEATGKPALVP